jgi:hypothetical protein
LCVLQQPSALGAFDEPIDKVCLTEEGEYKESKPNKLLTFWRRIFFQILAHPVFKM